MNEQSAHQFANSYVQGICEVAKCQSAILYCVLANLLLMVVAAWVAPLLMQVAGLVISICSIVFFVKLRFALNKKSVPLTIVMVILMLVPLINVLLLVGHVIAATKVLRAAGLKVGLLGVSAAELARFRSSNM